MGTRARAGGALSTVLLLVLAGCGGGAAEATDTPGFGSCIDEAGLSLSGSEEWAQSEWSDFFSRPEALICAVDDLGEEDRRTALTEAFPPYWEDLDQGALESRLDALAVYSATATAAEGEASALVGGRALVQSLDWESVDAVELAVLHLVVAALREQGDLVDYEPRLPNDTSQARGTDRRDSIGRELRVADSPLGDRFRDLYDGVLDSVDASALVP